MKRRQFLSVLLTSSGWIAAQSHGGSPRFAGAAIVDLQGKIEKVQIVPGAGAPSLVVDTGAAKVTVILGPLRYLMEKDFNPKAGELAEVHGLQVDTDVFAVTVVLPASKRMLRLREADGRPLWRGFGRHSQRHGARAR
jgi:hypothetical protein